MPPPIVITGAAGFIGSHLARALIADDHDVVGIDNFDPFYPRAAKERNLSMLDHERFTLIEMDVRDSFRLADVMRDVGPCAVYHIAALAGVRPSIEHPQRYVEVNVTGTANVLHAAHQAGCDNVIFASSSSVYGARDDDCCAFAETDDTTHPISPYAATKCACETLCRTWAGVYGLRVACMRLFTVFGPGQRPDLAIARFMRLIAAGRPVPMFGDGSTSRDYTYVGDIVAGLMAAARAIACEQAGSCRIWNLGGSEPISLAELIRVIGEVTGHVPTIEQLPLQPGDVPRTHADLARVRAELGWSPSVGLREGLAKQWAWCRATAEAQCPA